MTQQLRPRSMLRDKQRLMHRYMMGSTALMLISYMSSGKTAAALTMMRDTLDRFEVRHWLVIAPKFVASNTWPDEIEEWKHTACMSYAVAVGTEKERIAAIEQRAEITTINFESLQWLAKYLGSIDNWYWDGVVIDESSRFKAGKKRTTRTRVKDPKTGQIKIRKGGRMTRFGVMSTARQKVSRIVELTGTPFPQGIHDAWGQAYLLDQGQRLGRTMTEFEERWFTKNEYTHEIKAKKGADAEIMALLDDILVEIPFEALVEEPIFSPVKVKLPAKVIREYQAFEKTLYSEAYDVEAVNRGVLQNKLLQFANGHMYREDGSVVKVHDRKLEALAEILQQTGDEPVVVFYSFKFDKDAIKEKYPHAVVANEDPDFLRKWNRKEIKLLLAHPASIGHGTNMQYGGHIAVWYGLTNNLEYYLQANLRLPRPGQTRQVVIFQIIADDTYDTEALVDLHAKDATQESLVAKVRHRHRKYATLN